jgi:hypothetical protein
MFHCKVGEAIRLRAFYVESKVGKSGLTVTVDYTDESGNATTGQSASAGAIAGEYYYTLTPDAAGMWCAGFKTATTTVDAQHRGAVIAVEADYTAARAASLDAAITSRLASAGYTTPPTASDMWAVSTRTLSSAGTDGVAAAVWAFGGRTLTSLTDLFSEIRTAVWGALKSAYTGATTMGGAVNAAGSAAATPEEIAAGILDALRTAHVDDDTIGEAIDTIYRKVLAPGGVLVSSPGPNACGLISIIPGDAYGAAHDNPIPIPIPSAPDVSGASFEWTVGGVTFSPAATSITVSGSGAARIANLELTAEQSALLAELPEGSTRPPRPEERRYWRVKATWPESPLKPQTIATGEIRRPSWDRR